MWRVSTHLTVRVSSTAEYRDGLALLIASSPSSVHLRHHSTYASAYTYTYSTSLSFTLETLTAPSPSTREFCVAASPDQRPLSRGYGDEGRRLMEIDPLRKPSDRIESMVDTQYPLARGSIVRMHSDPLSL